LDKKTIIVWLNDDTAFLFKIAILMPILTEALGFDRLG
jgi:hypothetical protein